MQLVSACIGHIPSRLDPRPQTDRPLGNDKSVALALNTELGDQSKEAMENHHF